MATRWAGVLRTLFGPGGGASGGKVGCAFRRTMASHPPLDHHQDAVGQAVGWVKPTTNTAQRMKTFSADGQCGWWVRPTLRVLRVIQLLAPPRPSVAVAQVL